MRPAAMSLLDAYSFFEQSLDRKYRVSFPSNALFTFSTAASVKTNIRYVHLYYFYNVTLYKPITLDNINVNVTVTDEFETCEKLILLFLISQCNVTNAGAISVHYSHKKKKK